MEHLSSDHYSLGVAVLWAQFTCLRCQTEQKKGNRPTRRHYQSAYLTFVTQQSSPVDVTDTLPGLRAAPVHTARERHTLVTQRTGPAVVTPWRDERWDRRVFGHVWQSTTTLKQIQLSFQLEQQFFFLIFCAITQICILCPFEKCGWIQFVSLSLNSVKLCPPMT